VNEISESPSYDRPKLMPRLGVLGVMNLLATLNVHTPFALFGIEAISIGYLAVIILRTQGLMANEARLHPTDRWILRKSGVLAAGLATALILGVSLAVAMDVDPAAAGLEVSWGLALLGFVMEIGVILCVACLWAPRSLRHTRPLIFWKLVAIPLLLIYATYVLLLVMVPAATIIRQE
jgi:hypothetical protein